MKSLFCCVLFSVKQIIETSMIFRIYNRLYSSPLFMVEGNFMISPSEQNNEYLDASLYWFDND